ncbi:MAG: heme-binding protein [Rhodospirillaceae bacterium]
MLMRSLISLAGSALLAGCSVVGVRSGTEQPRYDVVERLSEEVEVRQYGERLAAEVTVARGGRSSNENSAFGALAGYIFGKNTARSEVVPEKVTRTSPVETRSNQSEKIAMTSPVETTTRGSEMTMRFFLPSAYTLESAPVPSNPKVSVVPVPPETLATLQFKGMRTTNNVETHKAELLKQLSATDWAPVGEPVAYFYDPPWTVPTLRRNEIAVKVEKRAG